MYMYKSFFVCMPLGGKGEVVFDKDWEAITRWVKAYFENKYA